MKNLEHILQILNENRGQTEIREYVEMTAKSDPNFFRWLFGELKNDFDLSLSSEQREEYQQFLESLQHEKIIEMKVTLESLNKFFQDRPKLSPSGVSMEAGYSAKYLRLILAGERPLTESAIEQLEPVLHLHGWGRERKEKDSET